MTRASKTQLKHQSGDSFVLKSGINSPLARSEQPVRQSVGHSGAGVSVGETEAQRDAGGRV